CLLRDRSPRTSTLFPYTTLFRSIEADAELADQGHVLGGVAAQLRNEFTGARAGDGAEIGDQLVPAHADAAIGDGERAGGLVGGKDRKSTRLNSSHVKISYAVVCL